MSKTYTIPEYKITIVVQDKKVRTIESDLKSLTNSSLEAGEFYAVIDTIESLLSAHACAGIDISSQAYVEGLKTCLETL